MKNCRVFIASPSDVQVERKIVRKVCDDLNKDPLVLEKRIILDPMGWEDVVPSAGRPQDTINLLVKDCDVFVCILHKKYGTPTGNSGSGTEEEFLNAYEDWKNFKKPKILFYFKKADVSSLAELKDPQIQKVFELKEKIQTNEFLLYGNFATSEEFETTLSNHLKKLIPNLAPEPDERPEKPAAKAKAIIPQAYRSFLNDRTNCMDIDCLRHDGSVINVNLPEIFQPLFSDDPDDKIKKEKKKEHEKGLENERKPVEIEALAAKGETLLVIGTAGSGKTTLAKHMARSIINNQSLFFQKDLLPLLICFKDLKDYPYQGKTQGAESAKDILDWYCKNFLSTHVDLETILLFCKAGKCVFLLDGLDEAAPDVRNFAAASFADFRHGHEGVKIILLGRPHGTEGGSVAERFGNRTAKVHDLTNEQAEAFIGKWFSHVFGDGSFTGKELAGRMRGDIRARNDIDDLKKNPLLLTAMCILYTDLKELPNQRADLYNRYVERLFSKFGEERIRVNRFMMEMAHSMFEQGDRGLDHAKGVSFLKKHFTLPDANTSFEDLFDRVEPATGLLHRENGQYKFIHLTFQEFLTAKYFVDQTKDSSFDIIAPYIHEKRYAEVVKLFIGFLSIRNSGAANAIVKKILDQEPVIHGYYNHILAAESLLDIHKDNRETEVASLSMDRMLTLIRAGEKPPILLQAGEAMGRLGYEKGLDDFVPIKGGTYDLEGLGKKEIKDFEISKFPVTNLWYGRFIKDKGYETPDF